VTAPPRTRLHCDPVVFAHVYPAGIVTLQHQMSHSMRHIRRGFTLIELLMIVVIVGLMSLIVLPKIRIDNTAVDSAARTISLSLMVAQREAVARGHNVLVMFDTAGHTARTVWDANNNGVADAGEKSRPFLLPERVLLGRPPNVPPLGGTGELAPTQLTTAQGPYFIMQRSGSLDRAQVIYISTAEAMNGGAYSDVRAVYIARATGRAVWYKWNGTAWGRG
jgi:prepilin-type N-terminal cleavage/methylation domain-containing protein